MKILIYKLKFYFGMLDCITEDISLRISINLWWLYLVQQMLHQIKAPHFYTELGLQRQC